MDGDGAVGAALLQWGSIRFQPSTCWQEKGLSDVVILCAACKGKERLGREGNGA